MKVVILAAGMGSRLQEILKGKPKPLLEINGKCLLEHSLESLKQSGITEVTLAIGFEGQQIRNRIGNKFGGKININYASNPQYDSSGSMYSLYCALETPQTCLVLDGDIVYDSKAITKIMETKHKNSVVLTDCCGSGDEVYVTLDDSNNVTYLGKKLPSQRRVVEFTGISKFSEEFMNKMFERHNQRTEKLDLTEYYEDAAYQVSKSLPWYGLVIPNLPWSEVDRKEDISRAINAIKNSAR